MSLKERREALYAKAVSVWSYSLPLYFGLTQTMKDRPTAVVVICNRTIYMHPILENKSNQWICKQIGVKTPRKWVYDSTLNFIH